MYILSMYYGFNKISLPDMFKKWWCDYRLLIPVNNQVWNENILSVVKYCSKHLVKMLDVYKKRVCVCVRSPPTPPPYVSLFPEWHHLSILRCDLIFSRLQCCDTQAAPETAECQRFVESAYVNSTWKGHLTSPTFPAPTIPHLFCQSHEGCSQQGLMD